MMAVGRKVCYHIRKVTSQTKINGDPWDGGETGAKDSNHIQRSHTPI